MKRVTFSAHAAVQMAERGASKDEVITTIHHGEKTPAKHGRAGFRHNFQYNSIWGGKHYNIKQVLVIVKEEKSIIVITVYTFYF